MSGIYWGLTALNHLGHPHALPREGLLEFVLACLHDNGGFGAAPGHDPHMLYTVSAVQIMATLDAWDELEKHMTGGREKIGRCESWTDRCRTSSDGCQSLQASKIQ